MPQAYFAVRVVIYWSDPAVNGSMTLRDYVRGESRIGRQGFVEASVGNLIGLITGGKFDQPIDKISTFEVYPNEVAAARRGEYLTQDLPPQPEFHKAH